MQNLPITSSMRIALLLCAFTLLGSSGLLAQKHTEQVLPLGQGVMAYELALLSPGASEFSTWALELQLTKEGDGASDEVHITYRVGNSPVKQLLPDPHVNDRESHWLSELHFAEGKEGETIQFRLEQGQVDKVILHQFRPGASAVDDTPERSLRSECPPPSIKTRSAWCPGGCEKNYEPNYTSVSHLIIHHSAGPNSSTDWAAVVRSYWDYHVNTRRWDDIGYNWLVDPDGIVYEGRGAEVQGAHFCGQNSNTEGICVIGTYTDVAPTDKAFNALDKLLAYRCSELEIGPSEKKHHPSSGRSLFQITGHRSDCSTECPGTRLWNLLPEVRSTTADYINRNCAAEKTLHLEANYDELQHQIALSWSLQNFDAEEEFHVQGSEKGVAKEDLAVVEAGKREFSVEEIEFGKTYTFLVYTSSAGENIYSNSVEVSIPTLSPPTLSPNPAAESMTLRLSNDEEFDFQNSGDFIYSVEIIDLSGKSHFQDEFVKSQYIYNYKLDVSQLSPGLYFLHLEGGAETKTFKFIKTD